jgi:hypothetical protein
MHIPPPPPPANKVSRKVGNVDRVMNKNMRARILQAITHKQIPLIIKLFVFNLVCITVYQMVVDKAKSIY